MNNSPKNIYTQNGYLDRADYLQCVADDIGVDIQTVTEVANLLGKEEDFDGLISLVESL